MSRHSAMARHAFCWPFWYATVLSFVVFSVTEANQTNQTRCLACSYTRAGDGTRDFECVSNATHFVQSLPVLCNFNTHACVTIAVYSAGYGHVASLSRSCYAQPSGGSPSCDGGTNPRCQRYCRTDYCNVEHGDIHATITANGVASLGLQTWVVWLLSAGGVLFLLCL
ncbi:hypothetical protein ACOMHN_041081 [Nucella lapillus]